MKFMSANSSSSVATILSLDSFVKNIDVIRSGGFNVISIRSSDGRINEEDGKEGKYELIDKANFPNIYVGVFDDLQLESERRMMKNMVFPQEMHIYPLLGWAKKVWEENGKLFVVHCTAGISRSSAIAVLLNRMISGNVVDAFEVNLHDPNKAILRLGEKFLGVDDVVRQVEDKIAKEWAL